MKVLLGNPEPIDQGLPVSGPTITTVTCLDHQNEDGSYTNGYVVGSVAYEVKEHLFDNPGPVTHLPGNEAVINVVRTWVDHGKVPPAWVSVEADTRPVEYAADFERFLADFWHCERGIPEDLEDTHYTQHGSEIYMPGFAPVEGEQ